MEASAHYLYPATLFAEKGDYEVTTILGSCIAVCLYDPVSGTGGINHYMLPLWSGNGLSSPKFGNIAIPKLIENMEVLGCQRKNLVAKIFGGWERTEFNNSILDIGRRNSLLAVQLLNEFQIPIVSGSTGGTFGRKLRFFTSTGEVFMKQIQSDNLQLG